MRRTFRYVALLGLLAVASTTAQAQSNRIPGTDVKLGLLDVGTDFAYWGKIGTFPGGVSGFSMSTTSCNSGGVDVPWFSPMQANHPVIAFLVAREANGRMEQISDRSYVKHGFFALSDSQCTPCQNPTAGDYLGVGCSDTYGTGTNASRFYLGPQEEINPWLGTWDPTCSLFDGPNCDGTRSYFGSEPNEVNHRITIKDQDLLTAGATYYYCGYYVILGEPVEHRDNNFASREFRPSWTGSSWSLDTNSFSNTMVSDSVLYRWTGATVDSATNGQDGRVYIASKVTGPVGGLYHYEFAVHNRDSNMGVGSLHIPFRAGAQILNPSFNDIDDDPSNDWQFITTADFVAFTTLTAGPQPWNTIYNFSFDSDVAPGVADLSAELYTGLLGPLLSISGSAPVLDDPVTYCSGKTTSQGCVPFVATNGVPSPTGTAAFTIIGNDHNVGGTGLIVYGFKKASLGFHGGTLCVKSPLIRTAGKAAKSKASSACGAALTTGRLSMNFNNRIQGGIDPLLTSGQQVFAQWLARDSANTIGGFGDSLSDGVRFTIGQ